MVFENIHREEAQSTDHDADPMELAGVAPLCKDCGKREAIDKRGFCDECDPEDNHDTPTDNK